MASERISGEGSSNRTGLEGRYTPETVNFIFSEVVQAVMIFDHSKKPFKKADLVSALNFKLTKRDWKEIMIQLEKRLDVLGLELHETQNTKVKAYFVVNKVQPLQIMHKFASEEEVSNRILLFFVLAYIFIKNGTVTTGELFQHLKDLTIYNDDNSSHPYFGDVKKKVMTQFVEQLYLSLQQVADSDEIEVSWGQRAELELTKRSVLEFICQCPFKGALKPEELAYQNEKIKEQEELDTFVVVNKSLQADLPN